jgi:acyl carrier protein
MKTTVALLSEILVKEYKLDPDSLTLDTPLEALGIDSLGVAELLFTVEDEFKVKVSSEPLKLATVGDVVGYIDALVAAQHGVNAEADVARVSA